MTDVYFLHQIKHNKNTGVWDKGIVIKENTNDNFSAVKQSYHAYLGAYAYGNNPETDYVSCHITNSYGGVVMEETWIAPEEQPAPEEA